jgi:phosphoribosyl-AMP cyclohydrolase
MMAYMNHEAWQTTVTTGKATYWSRSRNKLWVKGESSGHIQKVHEIWLDCDSDTILLKVTQIGGAACHTGHRSCFYRRLDGDRLTVVGEPLFDPQEVYGK